MKALAILSILLAFAFTASFTSSGGAVPFGNGPDMIISSVSGNLEMGRAGTIALEIRNNASEELQAPGDFGSKESAMGIVAELQSQDERITVLPSPQAVGSLAPGESRSIEFAARADREIDAGVYPFELMLSYSRLSDVNATGDMIPDVLFRYENADKILPVEVKVVLGPRINLADVRGTASPGERSDVEMVFANIGDELVQNIVVQLFPQDPFMPVISRADIKSIEPGSTTSAKFSIFTKNHMIAGTYALPYRISYRYGQSGRSEDLAALVDVKENSWMGIAVPAAAILLIAVGIYIGIKKLPGRKKRLRKR